MSAARQKNGRVQWIVVTDDAEARVWSRQRRAAPVLVESYPAGHLREQELVSDEPGRMSARGRGHTQAMKQRGSARHTEQVRCAAAVGAHLTRALQQSPYDERARVAAPRWLGELRDHLDQTVPGRVVAEVHHSLMHDRIEDSAACIDEGRAPRPTA